MKRATRRPVPKLARIRAERAADVAAAATRQAVEAWRAAKDSLSGPDLTYARELQHVAAASVHHAIALAIELGRTREWPADPPRPTWAAWPDPSTIVPRPPRQGFGRCQHCGVVVLGPAANGTRLRGLMAGHEQYCPGGLRGGEIWRPFAMQTARGGVSRRRLRLVVSSTLPA